MEQSEHRAPGRPNWRPSKISSTDKAVTVMVDLTRDEHGCVRARLLDAVQGRSGRVYADWLADHGIEGVDVKVTIEHAALDPFRGYANAIRDEPARQGPNHAELGRARKRGSPDRLDG